MPSAIECDALEPYKIICVTCQAKLSVRNESLIGQIVACPRCDSMVEVTPPVAASVPVTPPPILVIEEVAAGAVAATATEATDLPVAEAEALPASVLASVGIAKYKLIAWSLASFLVGATLVGSVLYTRSDSNNEATALVPNPSQTTPTPVAEELPALEEPVTDSPPIVETQPEVETPESKIEESLAADPVTEPVEPPTPDTPAEELPEETLRIARRFDPLDFDPESLTLATVDQPTNDPEPAPLDSPDEPVEVSEENLSTVPLVRRGPDEGEDASGRDAEKQLALLIPKVTIDRMPLVDCLRIFSQLSGVPVSVSPEQLLMAGITSQKSVSLDATELSLGEMLKQVLQPLRLEYTTRGAQVIVTRQEATKRREINYPINDLVGAETSEEVLAGWIEQLVAPTTWKTAGGEGTLESTAGSLRIKQTQQVQYQVLITLERLRLARNLPPKSRYPVKRLAGTPANVLLQEKLAKSTTFTFSQFTAIDEIFVHWQTELDVPLLIDWPALAEAEVWPTTTIACAMIDQPWNVALEKILEPLGLGWRATTGGAIEITSAEKVQSELQLELYPLLRDFDGDTKPLLALNNLKTAGMILYDPAGKVLLALESASTQRAIFQQLSERQLLNDE